ncbi:Geraniol 8-hydroxylase [Bienertia sinuspersici]
MDYLSFVSCLLLAWVVIHILLNVFKHNESNTRVLPPGPPTIPIFGNLFSLGTKPHVSLTELSKKYGPIMRMQLGQVPIVVISSSVIAKEALQKNDVSISNRPIIDAVRALNHQQKSFVWLSVSPLWKKLRKLSNSEVFSTSKLDATQSFRRKKVRDLLDYVKRQSEDHLAVSIGQVAFSTTLNLLLSTFFSVDLSDINSEFAHEFRETIRGIMEEVGKPNFADYFPVLRVIDPQGIRRRISVHFRKMIALFNTMIDERLQEKRPPGLIQDSDVLDALLRLNREKPEEMELSTIRHLLLDLFDAGTDTTSTTIEWAMTELLRNREKMKKAQEELRETIGKGTPMNESDIIRLPYLQAVVKETLRLHPPAPFLVPRKADSDINLFGFTVPKGMQVQVNVWAIGRDPSLWENPNSFEPERFMGADIDVKGGHFELIPFGAGRRICPGLPLAFRMIHLMVGSFIHEFDWELEGGVLPEKMDMEEKFGITMEKAQRLKIIPTLRT